MNQNKTKSFDREKYAVWTWKNPFILHWILNPGLIINELIFGQSVPKIILIEKNKSKPFFERFFIPCPNCGFIHPNIKWNPVNKLIYKNWFGLYCDKCGDIIPPQRNLFSLLMIGITYPFWFKMKDVFKEKWLKRQPNRYINIQDKHYELKPHKHWILFGFLYSSFFVLFILKRTFLDSDFTLNQMLVRLPLTFIVGFGISFLLHYFNFNNK